jgi:HSP20 family protein
MPSLFGNGLDNMFQGFFHPMTHGNMFNAKNLLPAVDIEEKEQFYLVMADLPGFDKQDINVSFNNGRLSIQAEHQEKTEDKNSDGYHLQERHYGSYFREFNFGSHVDANDISAKYENGVLELTIPKLDKTPEEPKRKININ